MASNFGKAKTMCASRDAQCAHRVSRRRVITALLVTLSCSMFVAATHAAQWAKGYSGAGNDSLSSVFPTADGGFIAAGDTNSFGAGDHDAWVLKLDAGGNVVWQRTYGGAAADFATSVKPTGDGGYVVGGYTTTATGVSGFVVRLDAGGNVTWQRSFAADSVVNAVEIASDGGHVLAGRVGSNAWTAKLDAIGNIMWQKTYNDSLCCASLWAAESIQGTTDGGYILTGSTFFRFSDAWVVKLDAAGSVVWARSFNGFRGISVLARPATGGGYVVAGSLFDVSPNSGFNAMLTKLDESGGITWSKSYFGERLFSWTTVSSVDATPNGGYVTTGTVPNPNGVPPDPPAVTKFDANGNISWVRTFGTNFSGFQDIRSTPDGGYIVAASTLSNDTRSTEASLLKLGVDGNILGCAGIGTATLSTGAGYGSGSLTPAVSTTGVANVTGSLTTGTSAATVSEPCNASNATVTPVPMLSNKVIILLAVLLAACGAWAWHFRRTG